MQNQTNQEKLAIRKGNGKKVSNFINYLYAMLCATETQVPLIVFESNEFHAMSSCSMHD